MIKKRKFQIFLFLILALMLLVPQIVNSQEDKKPLEFNPENKIKNFDDKLNNVLNIPEPLEKLSEVAFRIKPETTISEFIIIIALFIMITIIITWGFSISEILGKGPINFIASIAIALLAGTSGVYRIAAETITRVGGIFIFLKDWNSAVIFAVIFILGILFWIGSKIFKQVKSNSELEEARKEGAEIGHQLGFLAAMRERMSLFWNSTRR